MAGKLSRRRGPLLLAALALGVLLAAAWLAWDSAEIVLTWEAGNELDIMGYNVLRAESPNGPLVVRNDVLIPAADAVLGGEHVFVDHDVRRGVTYYYHLETVFLDGRTRLQPQLALRAR